MPMFIDTHCHFDFPPFIDNLSESLTRLQQANLIGVIVPSVSADRFDGVLTLAKDHPAIYASLGLHPIYPYSEKDLQVLRDKLARDANCPDKTTKLVAVGEIGLDRYILAKTSQPDANWQRQLALFRAQLMLAKRFDLPVIIHSRQAHDAVCRELQQAKLPCGGVIHGFSGSYEQALQFVKLGFYIGVGGVISYPRANKTRNAIAKLPKSCLLLETDAPDMPLSGQQGRANRPENIVHVLAILAALRTEPAKQLSEHILNNTLTLFSNINKVVY